MSDENMDPVERDLAWLNVISNLFFSDDASKGRVQEVIVTLSALRASIAGWAHLVVELTHEKHMALAEVDRLRLELERLRAEVKP